MAAPKPAPPSKGKGNVREEKKPKSGFNARWSRGVLALGLIAVQLATAETTSTGSALSALFAWVPRLLLGGLVAFLVSQWFDVWMFIAIKKATRDRHLWLRASGSTMVSQAIDTIIVWHTPGDSPATRGPPRSNRKRRPHLRATAMDGPLALSMRGVSRPTSSRHSSSA